MLNRIISPAQWPGIAYNISELIRVEMFMFLGVIRWKIALTSFPYYHLDINDWWSILWKIAHTLSQLIVVNYTWTIDDPISLFNSIFSTNFSTENEMKFLILFPTIFQGLWLLYRITAIHRKKSWNSITYVHNITIRIRRARNIGSTYKN